MWKPIGKQEKMKEYEAENSKLKGDIWECTGCKDTGHFREGFGVCRLLHGVPGRDVPNGKPDEVIPITFTCEFSFNQNWKLVKEK